MTAVLMPPAALPVLPYRNLLSRDEGFDEWRSRAAGRLGEFVARELGCLADDAERGADTRTRERYLLALACEVPDIHERVSAAIADGRARRRDREVQDEVRRAAAQPWLYGTSFGRWRMQSVVGGMDEFVARELGRLTVGATAAHYHSFLDSGWDWAHPWNDSWTSKRVRLASVEFFGTDKLTRERYLLALACEVPDIHERVSTAIADGKAQAIAWYASAVDYWQRDAAGRLR